MKPLPFKHPYPFGLGNFIFVLLTTFVLVSPVNSFSQNYAAANSPTGLFIRLNEINARAARHFINNFRSDGREKWEKSDDGFIAIYSEGDGTIQNRVYYSKNGDFRYSARTYGADQLNQPLKRAVLDRYSGYSVKSVLEISDLKTKGYFIHIANPTNIKTLKYVDGRFEVTENYQNGGV